MWNLMNNGETIGRQGSESGCITADEEYNDACRITLEKGGVTAPYSITCGTYGLMVYTAFAGNSAEAKHKYGKMKEELQAFIDSDCTDCEDWCERFIERW